MTFSTQMEEVRIVAHADGKILIVFPGVRGEEYRLEHLTLLRTYYIQLPELRKFLLELPDSGIRLGIGLYLGQEYLRRVEGDPAKNDHEYLRRAKRYVEEASHYRLLDKILLLVSRQDRLHGPIPGLRRVPRDA